MKNWILFFTMVVFMYLYSYILGGETSMVMTYMFLFSPVVSVLLVFPFRKNVAVYVDMPYYEVEKGGVVRVNIRLENRSFMPFPFISIEFCEAINFKVSDSYNMIVSLGPFEKKVITMEYTAISRGVSKIGVSGVWIKDYINLFKLSILKNSAEERFAGEVTVLPKLVSLKSTSKILLGAEESIKQEDLNTPSMNLITWNGEPGYEFREYIPGDPLHKIHWKLSARSETLMVRKDEGRGISKKRLFLDPYIKTVQKKQSIDSIYHLLFGLPSVNPEKDSCNMENKRLKLEEKVLETLLAVAHTSVKTGREVELWLFEEGKWNKYEISDSKVINEIQYRLASYKFEKFPISDFLKRLPLNEVDENEGKSRYLKGTQSIVFTGNCDNALYSAIKVFSEYGVDVDIVLVEGYNSDSASIHKVGDSLIHHQSNYWVLGVDEDISEAFS